MPSADAERGGFRPLRQQTAFRGHLLSVVQRTFEAPDGSTFERDVVHHPGAVAVVAVTGSGSVVLVRQYRGAVDRWLLEIPAGTRDVDGEAAEATARRELAEEAGYAAGRMDLLAEILNTPGFCDESTSLFLATDLRPTPPERDGVEERFLTVEEVALDRFDAMVDDGAIVDAQTILGVGLARRRLATGAGPTGGA